MFLDHINNGLFKPLVSKNSRLYGLGLWAIYEELVRNQITGECTPQQARAVIRSQLLTSNETMSWSIETDGEDEIPNTLDLWGEIAGRIYAVLRETKWIVEMDARGYKRVVFMPQDATRLLVALDSLSRKRKFSMVSTFQGVYRALREASNNPVESADQIAFAAHATNTLSAELNSIAASARELTHKMRTEKKGATLFQTFFKNFLEETLGPYDDIKTRSNPFKYRTETLDVITTILRNDEMLNQIADTMAKESGKADVSESLELVTSDLMSIYRVFEQIPELMDRVDEYRSITTRQTREAMQYAYKAIPDMGLKIEKTIKALSNSGADEDIILTLPRLGIDEMLSNGRLQKPRQAQVIPEPTPKRLKTVDIRDIAFSRCNDEYLMRRSDNPDRLERFLIKSLNGDKTITTDDLVVETVDDFMAYSQLRELVHNSLPANSIYSDLSQKFRVTPIDSAVTSNRYLQAPALLIEHIER